MGEITTYPSSEESTLSQRFVATPNQTIFTPTLFVLSNTCLVLVNGVEQSWGWTRVNGSIVFSIGLNEGTEVLIIN